MICKPNAIRRSYHLIILMASAWLFSGCHTHFIPIQHEYQRYHIDQSLPVDSSILYYYQPFKAELEAEMNKVIGVSAAELIRSRREPETQIGNFFAGVLLEAGLQHDPGVQFAVATKDGVRRDLPQGELTVGHIFELMPFENKVVLLEITGKKVKELANFIASTGGQPVAGITLRIQNGKATNIKIAGKDLDESTNYKLVTYDYLANGGDRILGMDSPINRIDLPVMVRETIIDYIQRETAAGKQIISTMDGRIK